jgi:hypothetical protein
MAPIDIPVATFEIKRTGVFDLDLLYKNMRKWFDDRGFVFQENVHKFKPPELELEWEGTRKTTGYRKNIVEMKFHSWYHKEITAKISGKEKKMVDARFQIKLSTKVVYDYKNKYDTPFKLWLQDFMHRFVLYYYAMIVWPDMAYYELVDLQTKIKEWINTTIPGGAY